MAVSRLPAAAIGPVPAAAAEGEIIWCGYSAVVPADARPAPVVLGSWLPGLDHVIVAFGSGATMAGLVAGLGAERVIGIDTGAVADPCTRLKELLDGMTVFMHTGGLPGLFGHPELPRLGGTS